MVTGFGVNEALVLDGKPVMLSVTELVLPIALKLTVTVPLDPRVTESVDGESERSKSAVTLSVTVAIWFVVCPAPVTVRV